MSIMIGLKDPKMGAIFVLYLTFLALHSSRVEGVPNLSKRPEGIDLDLDMQLKLLNKPAVKSFKTKHGDIYDCVDIKKQPAFDHPLLKNHTIQMKPSSYPAGLIKNKQVLKSKSHSNIRAEGSKCPPGTVLIRRTQRKELLWAKSQVRKHPRNSHQLTAQLPGYQYATFFIEGTYYGGNVHLSIEQPKLRSNNQFSEASLWLANGPADQINSIQVGWTVQPNLYGDNKTRSYSYWTADGFHRTGCYNHICPGFVQVSNLTTFGFPYSMISTYHKDRIDRAFFVYKDPKSGNWWYVEDMEGQAVPENVGYWPAALFTSLRDHASVIQAGGGVYCSTSEPCPEMGNGHFPTSMGIELNLTSTARRLQFVDNKNYVRDPPASLKQAMATTACYKTATADHPPYNEDWMNTLLFGGPGGECGT